MPQNGAATSADANGSAATEGPERGAPQQPGEIWGLFNPTTGTFRPHHAKARSMHNVKVNDVMMGGTGALLRHGAAT